MQLKHIVELMFEQMFTVKASIFNLVPWPPDKNACEKIKIE